MPVALENESEPEEKNHRKKIPLALDQGVRGQIYANKLPNIARDNIVDAYRQQQCDNPCSRRTDQLDTSIDGAGKAQQCLHAVGPFSFTLPGRPDFSRTPPAPVLRPAALAAAAAPARGSATSAPRPAPACTAECR